MRFFERQILLFIACALLSLSQISCGGEKAKEAGKTMPSPEPGRTEAQRRGIEESKNSIVAKINGAPISGFDLVNEMNSIAPQYIKPGQAKDPKVDERIRKEALDRLIYRELVFQEARRQGLKAPSGAVAEELKRIRTELKTEEAFRQYLVKSGIAEEELKAGIERAILVEMITDKEIFEKITFDPGAEGPEMDKDKMAAAVRKREDAWISGLKKKAKIEIALPSK